MRQLTGASLLVRGRGRGFKATSAAASCQPCNLPAVQPLVRAMLYCRERAARLRGLWAAIQTNICGCLLLLTLPVHAVLLQARCALGQYVFKAARAAASCKPCERQLRSHLAQVAAVRHAVLPRACCAPSRYMRKTCRASLTPRLAQRAAVMHDALP
jgi:hypothetical protein